MKIICKWVFKEKVPNSRFYQLKAKEKDASNMTGDECIEMITKLLAQKETVRIMFEKKEK